jgi:hypothetical protein
MAQALVVVCDACGSPAVETVTIKVAARSYQKDVCQDPPRRDDQRRPGTAARAPSNQSGPRRCEETKQGEAPREGAAERPQSGAAITLRSGQSLGSRFHERSATTVGSKNVAPRSISSRCAEHTALNKSSPFCRPMATISTASSEQSRRSLSPGIST